MAEESLEEEVETLDVRKKLMLTISCERTKRNSESDEELDRIADTAIAALQDILKYFNVGEVTIDEYEGDDGELILDITGDDLAVLIGRHGKTLDALQFLVSAITVRTIGFRYPVVIDVEGYKSRQRQKARVDRPFFRQSSGESAPQREASSHDAVRASIRCISPFGTTIVLRRLRKEKAARVMLSSYLSSHCFKTEYYDGTLDGCRFLC